MRDVIKGRGNTSHRTEPNDWIYDDRLGKWWQVARVMGPEHVVIDGHFYRVNAGAERCALYGQMTARERQDRQRAVAKLNEPMTAAGRVR